MILETVDKQKLRGGYYTPLEISEFLTDWALQGATSTTSVLEPSMGDGAFIVPAAKYLRAHTSGTVGPQLHGAELFDDEIDIARSTLRQLGFQPELFNFYEGDFFQTCESSLGNRKFDVILGNPPFIRYQNFPAEQRDRAMLQLAEAGFKLNKLTNAWLFFLLKAAMQLKDKGRLAMVIPAELLQVKYAEHARLFLSEHFTSVTVVSFRQLVFAGIQQEVVLLLAEKIPGTPKRGIDVVELDSAEDLPAFKHTVNDTRHFKPIDHLTDKWTQYFLDKEEILALRNVAARHGIAKLGAHASVDVGIVTGNNSFFVLKHEQIAERGLAQNLEPLVGRSAALQGIVFSNRDWQALEEKGLPAFILALKESSDISSAVAAYLKFGIEEKVHEGYKCRIRKKWYVVPSVWAPDAFMLRQIHAYPKIITNNAGALCTDTIHRVRMKDGVNPKLFAPAFINSLSFAFSEVVGRSYGGGVLELEPNEAEEVLICYDENAAANLDPEFIDRNIRNGDIEKALDHVDNIMLKSNAGFSDSEISKLRGIWKKLAARRINRK